MRIVHYTDIEPQTVEQGAKDVEIRWLIDEESGGKNFCMRQFEIEPGGYTPHHEHEWEHEIYILVGEGEVVSGDTPHPFRPGDAIIVPGYALLGVVFQCSKIFTAPHRRASPRQAGRCDVRLGTAWRGIPTQ